MLELPTRFELLDEIDYEDAAWGGGTLARRLPVLVARGVKLPEPLSGLVLTSDLQGMEASAAGRHPRSLAGLVLRRIRILGGRGALPQPSRMGAILAGDLFAVEDLSKRGVSGPVDEVWTSFAEEFRWVAGVLGNHDQLQDRERLVARSNLHLLNGNEVDLDGLRIAGVSGIIGRPTKLNRQRPEDFLEKLRECTAARPDLVVLHEGPGIRERNLRGSPLVREALESAGFANVAFGHCHWEEPVVDLEPSIRLLNLDAKVLVMLGADARS